MPKNKIKKPLFGKDLETEEEFQALGNTWCSGQKRIARSILMNFP